MSSTIKKAEEQIIKLQKEIDFCIYNLTALDEAGIDFLLVDHSKHYTAIIKADDMDRIHLITKMFKPSDKIENNIKSAGGKEWKNTSPFLIKTDTYSNEYSHLEHYFKLTYAVSDELHINIEVNIKLKAFGLNLINSRCMVTKETEHRRTHKEYEMVNTLNKDVLCLSDVEFYGRSFYYYASNEEQAKMLIKAMNIYQEKGV